MRDNYRLLAPVYSPLSTFVFGGTREQSNIHFLKEILGRNILILGGGDGKCYQELASEMKGEYWEKSAAMLHLAQDNLRKSRLGFHLGEWNGEGTFEAILFPFVLDFLSDEEIFRLLEKAKASLTPGGCVILSDFFPPTNWKQKLTFKVMLKFHQLFTSHERNDLPDYPILFKNSGFNLLKEKSWKNGWIKSLVYGLSES